MKTNKTEGGANHMLPFYKKKGNVYILFFFLRINQKVEEEEHRFKKK